MSMIDIPIVDLFDGSHSRMRLECQLHPEGFVCPHYDGMSILHFPRSWMIGDTIDSSRCH